MKMPLRVLWPDGTPLDGGSREEALQAALGRGLRRALERADETVVRPRGAYARPRVLAPRFTFVDPNGSLDSASRTRMEELVNEAVREAVEAQLGLRVEDASEVLPDSPRERLDWKRHIGREYRVPSYEGDPDPEDVPLDRRNSKPPAQSTSHVWWEWDGSKSTLEAKIRSHIASTPALRNQPFSGMIFSSRRGGDRSFWAAQFKIHWSGGDFRFDYRFEPIIRSFLVIEQGRVVTRNEPARGVYRHLLQQSYEGPDQLRSIIEAPFLKIYGLPVSPPANETEQSRRMRAACLEAIDGFVRQHGHLPGRAVSRLISPLGTSYYLSVPRSLFIGYRECSLYAMSQAGPPRRRRALRSKSKDSGPRGVPDVPPGGTKEGEPSEPPPDAGRKVYPRVQVAGDELVLDFSPFLGEPSVKDLGAAGEALQRLIRRIAFRLEMPEGEYCGAFLIAAAQMLGARAAVAGQFAATSPRSTRRVEPGRGNLGDVNLTPERSPAARLLRFVAGTCPLISRLSELMTQVYSQPQVSQHYLDRYRGRPMGWKLHFDMVHSPAMRTSIGILYIRSCQTMMLQMLRSSREQILNRITHFDRYFPVFERLIVGLVSNEAELRGLRKKLQDVVSEEDPSLQTRVSGVVDSWREARQLLSTSLSQRMLDRAGEPEEPQGVAFQQSDGSWAIRDTNGRVWSLQQLESAIAMRNQTATSIDPLIHQLTDIPDVVHTFKSSPQTARGFLYALLMEMLQNNIAVTSDVLGDSRYAFRSGKIREDLPNRTVPGTDVALQGIHLVAHEAIGDAFQGDRWYGIGLDWVFSVELGRLGLISFFETSLILGLSVLCPPAGAALGAAAAIVHRAQVQEHFRIRGAVLNPNELYDRAELELDLFLAELEVVLSIAPESGSLLRGATRGTSVIASQGVRRGTRQLTREARGALVRSVARQLERGLPKVFLEELVTDQVMSMLLPQVLAPVIHAVDAEIRGLTAPASPSQSANSAAAPPESDARPTTPEGIEFYRRLDEYQPSPDEERRTPAEDQP
ncbi:MAG: hypothetical protein RL885_20475 [Planctomycetota bacterium]